MLTAGPTQLDGRRRLANNVQTELLRKAVACLGSTQALATELRVPEGTLLRWASGRAMMPERAFKKLVDIVAQHVKQDGRMSAADSGPKLNTNGLLTSGRAAHR